MSLFSKPKIAVISDLHIGVHGDSSQWHEIALNWAKWLDEELQRHEIKDIMFCGDWYHNRSEISVSTLQVSAEILRILQNYNIVMITGNHDIFFKHRTDVNSLTIFEGRNNVSVFTKLHSFESFGKKISLCPWATNIQDIPKSDLIFGHFEIEAFQIAAGKLCEEGIEAESILDIAPLVISGHFHTRHEKEFDKGKILYTGNPFQMDFGDSGNLKGYYILDIPSMDYCFYNNPTSPLYIRLNLSDLTDIGTITSDVIEKIENNIVKFKIDDNISQEDLQFLTQLLTQFNPMSFSVDYDINFNRILSDIDKTGKDFSGIDIPQAISEFVNLLDIQNKKEIIDYTLGLYKKSKA